MATRARLHVERLLHAQVVDAAPRALLAEGVASPRAAAHGPLAVALHLRQLDAGDRAQRLPRRVVDIVVAPEIARIVVGEALVQAVARRQASIGDELFEELHVVDHLEVQPEICGTPCPRY